MNLRVEVAERRLDLDRRDRHGLQPGHPAAGESAERAEGHEREPGRPAGYRVRRTEFGVDQREQRENRAARIHETIDAPPATLAAVRAPRSQPDPMMEPSEIKVSPRSPTARRRWFAPDSVGATPGEVVAIFFLPYARRPTHQAAVGMPNLPALFHQ